MSTDDPPPDDAIPCLKRNGIRRKVIEEDLVLLAQGSTPSFLVQNIHAQFQQQSSEGTVFVMSAVFCPVWPKSVALLTLTHVPFFLPQIPLGFFRNHTSFLLDLVDPLPTRLDVTFRLQFVLCPASPTDDAVDPERFRVGEHPLAFSAPSYL